MKDFRNFEAGLGSKTQIVNAVLNRRGNLHLYAPNDPKESHEIEVQRDVVIEILSRYHKWLNDPTMP